MGKIKKLKLSQKISKVPLHKQIEDDNIAQPKNKNKIRPRKDDDEMVRN